MSKRFPLAAEARVALANPDRFLPQIARHLEGHGARTSWRDGAAVIDFDFSRGVMQPHVDGLAIRAEAMDRSLLQEIQMELAEHLGEFAGVRPGDVVWRGDACGSDTPPNFRLLRVVEARYVTPHMRRVRLAGENLLRFSGSGNLHCKLLIPPSGIAPEWPTLDAGGSFRWPSGPGKPAIRKYTIRGIDVENGTLEVDLVVHGDNGPGSAWAISASPGDVVGMVGPGGRGVAPADWYLLAGDETALPAIARTLESLPSDSRGVALVEVAGRREEQDLVVPEGFRLAWLHRDAAASGTTSLLAQAVRAVSFPPELERVFVWAGCEFDTFKAIRAYVRRELRLPKDRHLVTSYWRRGYSEDSAEKLDSVSNAVAAIGRRIGIGGRGP